MVGLGCFIVCVLMLLVRCLSAVVPSTPRVPDMLSGYALYIFFGAILFNATDTSYFRPASTIWVLLLLTCTISAVQAKLRKGAALRSTLASPSYSGNLRPT